MRIGRWSELSVDSVCQEHEVMRDADANETSGELGSALGGTLEFVSESVYVDLQYDEISLTFTAGPVCLCGVSSPVVVLGLFVRLS